MNLTKVKSTMNLLVISKKYSIFIFLVVILLFLPGIYPSTNESTKDMANNPFLPVSAPHFEQNSDIHSELTDVLFSEESSYSTRSRHLEYIIHLDGYFNFGL